MDKINNDPNKMPFLPFPPIPPKNRQINDKSLKEGDNLNKKPNEEPFLPFPPEKKSQTEKDNIESIINKDLLEDKVKLSWKDNKEEGFDLNQVKDVFIKSKSIM